MNTLLTKEALISKWTSSSVDGGQSLLLVKPVPAYRGHEQSLVCIVQSLSRLPHQVATRTEATMGPSWAELATATDACLF
jgi:hypothetical protein